MASWNHCKREGKVTYHVLLEDDRVMRRHIDHVHSQTTDSTVEMDLPQDFTDEDEILFDTPSPVTPRHEPSNDDNVNPQIIRRNLPMSNSVAPTGLDNLLYVFRNFVQ